MAKIRILLAEDEFLIAQDLCMRLEQMGYEVAGHAASAEEALEILKNHTVDIGILDINLSGMIDGISLGGQIKRLYDLPLIFLTSQSDDETFNQARQVGPSAFLLKPYQERELKYAIELAFETYNRQVAEAPKEDKKPEPAEKTAESPVFSMNNSIFLRKNEQYVRVDFEEILWAEALSNYVKVVTTHGEFVLSVTLQKIQDQLTAPFFVRVHRSFLVNVKKVDAIDGNMLYVNKKAIAVSRNKKEEVFHYFKLF